MNPYLREVFERSVRLLEGDPRVLAAYHAGSIGTGAEDELSDVDPVFVVKADGFASLDRDLRGLFESLSVEPILWWPERVNGESFKNYAIFFRVQGELVQYDINLVLAEPGRRFPVAPALVLFDKSGVLEPLPETATEGYPPERLGWTLEIYWIYAYIHAKYLLRKDFFKLMYAQDELFQAHREVLRAANPHVRREWWPLMVKHLPEQAQATLRLYFGHADVASVLAAFPRQLDAFSRDAKRACAQWNVPYPQGFEEAVLAHIKAHVAPLG